VNMNILAPKMGTLHRGLQTQSDDFLENGFGDYD
jgi:hypothetical protein